MPFWDRNKNSQELRVIKTARDKDSINRAAKSGLKPLIKKVIDWTFYYPHSFQVTVCSILNTQRY